MAEMIAMTPCGDLLPQRIGDVTVEEVVIDRMWSVAPFAGQAAATAQALGLALPAPNRTVQQGDTRIIWAGRGVWLVQAPALPALDGLAALTDQADAWAVVHLRGAGSVATLARLVPLDLRPAAFGVGQTARSLLGHMTASVTRMGDDTFEIMVMRSMAATLVHELTTAATHVAARATL